MRAAAAVLAVIAGAGGAGCGAAATGPVELSASWPEDPPSLEDATRAWTRSDRLVGSFSEQMELIAAVHVTFKSPQWRAALVEREARRGELDAAATEARLAEEKKAAAEHHEFVLLLTTHDRRLNDLTKGDRSVWSLRLRDGSGTDVAPVEVKKDRRPRSEIASELPHLGDFDQIYIVKFPGDVPIVGASADKFSLKMWSGRGALELVWSAL